MNVDEWHLVLKFVWLVTYIINKYIIDNNNNTIIVLLTDRWLTDKHDLLWWM